MSLILDSVTVFPPNARGRAAIAASHGGVYAAYLAAKAGIKAVIVYPMNALANSQKTELEKFLSAGYPDGRGPVRFERYTGQEKLTAIASGSTGL